MTRILLVLTLLIFVNFADISNSYSKSNEQSRVPNNMSYQEFRASLNSKYEELDTINKITLYKMYEFMCYSNIVDQHLFFNHHMTDSMLLYKSKFDSVFDNYVLNNLDKFTISFEPSLLSSMGIKAETEGISDLGEGVNDLLKFYESSSIKYHYLKESQVIRLKINTFERTMSLFSFSHLGGTPQVVDWIE